MSEKNIELLSSRKKKKALSRKEKAEPVIALVQAIAAALLKD